jgi:hypothetical protein
MFARRGLQLPLTKEKQSQTLFHRHSIAKSSRHAQRRDEAKQANFKTFLGKDLEALTIIWF